MSMSKRALHKKLQEKFQERLSAMNIAKRKFRKRIQNNDYIQYSAVHLLDEVIAVTRFPVGYSPLDVFFNNKRLAVVQTWFTTNIEKAEYDTLVAFGVPFVPTTYNRTINLDPIIKKNDVQV